MLLLLHALCPLALALPPCPTLRHSDARPALWWGSHELHEVESVARIEIAFSQPVDKLEVFSSNLHDPAKISNRNNQTFLVEFHFGETSTGKLTVLRYQALYRGRNLKLNFVRINEGVLCSDVVERHKRNVMTEEKVTKHENFQKTHYNSDGCGSVPKSSEVDLVHHAYDATKGAWPWLVAIYWNVDSREKFQCGGSLIGRNLVVTALHCVYKVTQYCITSSQVLVYVGQYNLKVKDEKGKQSVRRIIRHPGKDTFSDRIVDIDLAVLVLTTPVEYSSSVQPVCLWSSDLDINKKQEGQVIGWGQTEDGNVSDVPKQLSMPIVSEEECTNSDHPVLQNRTGISTFCAGHRNKSGPCKGDSGGGMFFKGKDLRWYLRGVVSKGLFKEVEGKKGKRGCDLEQFSIFVDIPKFTTWLLKVANSINGSGEQTEEEKDCRSKVIDCDARIKEDIKLIKEFQLVHIAEKYRYIDTKIYKNWSEAFEFCQSRGLQLASIESKEENMKIGDYIFHTLKREEAWGFWLGGTDAAELNSWVWMGTGRNFEFTDWIAGPPIFGHGRCTMLEVLEDSRHWWVASDCSRKRHLICELVEDPACL